MGGRYAYQPDLHHSKGANQTIRTLWRNIMLSHTVQWLNSCQIHRFLWIYPTGGAGSVYMYVTTFCALLGRLYTEQNPLLFWDIIP